MVWSKFWDDHYDTLGVKTEYDETNNIINFE